MSRKNIIAFSGTHGTGKSYSAYNLAIMLKKRGYNIVVLDELARECPLKINREAGALTQYWILSAQIKREIELMDRYDYIISDRSIIDTLSYAVSLNLLNFDVDSFVTNYVKKYYHSIFLLNPTGFDYQIDDGIRDMDTDFRDTVHLKLRNIYDNYNIPYHFVDNSVDLDDKIKHIFN